MEFKIGDRVAIDGGIENGARQLIDEGTIIKTPAGPGKGYLVEWDSGTTGIGDPARLIGLLDF